eukprot:7185433-Prorocentrum_lima.AAC.1
MTSSLVGSEMCIRDSSDTSLFQNSDPASQWNRITTCSPATLFNSANTEPVSYTHLTLPTICSV